jgi:hypothetical protein
MAEKISGIQNNNQSERTASAALDTEFKPGPYVAIVRNHLDSKYMGNLEVELLTQTDSGNSTNTPGQIYSVSYLSPFYGTTPYEGLTKNEGHQFSQKSYGMWFVPPDIGTKVLVIFAQGGQGFWMGCVQEDYMNMMVPGSTPASTYNDQDETKKLPVGEYNKKIETAAGRDPTKFIKPTNTDALEVLTTQGLDQDSVRGLTTSSARRELPSMVFGISTPGPQDRREGAPKARYGEQFAQTTTAFNRLGGSSLVFDDGDPTLLRKTPAGGPNGGPPVYVNAEAGEEGGNVTLPHNELVRLRTRTGHQILLHNTEDLIYIANAKGTTWIELTSNGKVDIYAASDVSIHSESDMNFKADGSVYIEAGADIHMKAGANIFQTSAANWEIKVGADGKLTTSANLDLVSGADTRSQAANTHWTASSHKFQGTIDQNGPAPSAPGEAADAEPSQRVPEHEPWDGHENLHTDMDLEVPPLPDTFRKSVTRDVGSQPSVQPPEAAPARTQTPAQTEAERSGVLKTPSTNTLTGAVQGLTSAMTQGVEAIKQSLTQASVDQLRNAVDFATINFPTAQTLIREIDNVVSPSQLRENVANATQQVSQSLRTASNNLLSLRTNLTRINTA